MSSWWCCPHAQKDYDAFRALASAQWARMERDPEAARVPSTRGLTGSAAMSRHPLYPAANASGEVAA